jgi:4-amino-4-deoxy-L-arabinose transferase-like glycosyltransferase
LGALVLLVGLWPWIGLFGREPWKSDEAYTFGLVWSMVEGKGLVIPLLGGEPFLEKPPLFYWVAAACTRLFGTVWAPHEAARLAIPLFLYATFGFLAATSRLLHNGKHGFIAIVLFISALGLFDKVHILITDVALMAGLSLGLLGIALALDRPSAGGVALGLGAGAAFMSKGLLGPGLLTLTIGGLLCFPSWRSRLGWRCPLVALAVLAPILVAWPLSLYLASPELFRVWLWDNNFARFLGFMRLGESHGPWFYPVTLLWFAFPIWPLAVCAVAAAYERRMNWSTLVFPGAVLSVTLVVLMAAAQSRAIYLLPALLPLPLLAVDGLDHAPRWAVVALQRAGFVLFSTLAIVLWTLWVSAASGLPAWTATMLVQREPGFVMSYTVGGLAFAVMGTILFGLVAYRRTVSAANAVSIWAAGQTACWILLMTLWLPYLDYGMGYRSVVNSLQQALPNDRSCIASSGLGEPQRAMLDYYARLITLPVERTAAANHCPWLLLQQSGNGSIPSRFAQWEEVWRGTRPGDGKENFYLLKRIFPQ